MKTRKLGSAQVSAIGLGTMSFGGIFGPTNQAESVACLDAMLDAGITFIDTANIYGMGVSEDVIGHWLSLRKPQVTIATKASVVNETPRRIDNSENHLRAELEISLRRLNRDHVELFYIHRRDHTRPIEEVVGTLKRFIDEGKIGGYGMSEVAPDTLRRARPTGGPVARAKRTDRAEARRHHRAEISSAEYIEADAVDAPSAPSAAPSRRPDGSPRPPSIGTAFRASFRPFDWKGDLRALPTLLRHRSFLIPLALTVGATAIAFLTNSQVNPEAPAANTDTTAVIAGMTKVRPSDFSEARRHAISGPMPISSSSGSPKLRRKKL